jgi:hypothetical protein
MDTKAKKNGIKLLLAIEIILNFVKKYIFKETTMAIKISNEEKKLFDLLRKDKLLA